MKKYSKHFRPILPEIVVFFGSSLNTSRILDKRNLRWGMLIEHVLNEQTRIDDVKLSVNVQSCC